MLPPRLNLSPQLHETQQCLSREQGEGGVQSDFGGDVRFVSHSKCEGHTHMGEETHYRESGAETKVVVRFTVRNSFVL